MEDGIVGIIRRKVVIMGIKDTGGSGIGKWDNIGLFIFFFQAEDGIRDSDM